MVLIKKTCRKDSATLHSFRKQREWFKTFGVGEMIREEQDRSEVFMLIIR